MANPQIIALGDSITYGYPFGHKYSWVELVSQKVGVSISNAGSNGDTFRDMINRLTIDIIDQSPDYVILLGGANDVYQGTNLEAMNERFEKIVKTLLQNKIKPILCLPTPIEEKDFEETLAGFRKTVKSLAKQKNLSLINFYDPFFEGKKKKVGAGLLEDGVHPSVAGYKLMADVAAPVLQKILK
ncbi:MAG: GDSL-type esterase/lipase family protein [bacterium]